MLSSRPRATTMPEETERARGHWEETRDLGLQDVVEGRGNADGEAAAVVLRPRLGVRDAAQQRGALLILGRLPRWRLLVGGGGGGRTNGDRGRGGGGGDGGVDGEVAARGAACRGGSPPGRRFWGYGGEGARRRSTAGAIARRGGGATAERTARKPRRERLEVRRGERNAHAHGVNRFFGG